LEGSSLCDVCSQNRKYEYKSLAYTSSVRPVLEYATACWDPCVEGQINALDRVQKKAAQFTNHTKDSDWETLFHKRGGMKGIEVW
jgi:hypothetical protein